MYISGVYRTSRWSHCRVHAPILRNWPSGAFCGIIIGGQVMSAASSGSRNNPVVKISVTFPYNCVSVCVGVLLNIFGREFV